MPQKPWSEIEIGDEVQTLWDIRLVIEVGGSRKTFAVLQTCGDITQGDFFDLRWVRIQDAEAAGWTLHGKAKAWEPLLMNETYFCFDNQGVLALAWGNSESDHRRRDGLGVYSTYDLAQAAFDRAKAAARDLN